MESKEVREEKQYLGVGSKTARGKMELMKYGNPLSLCNLIKIGGIMMGAMAEPINKTKALVKSK